jgi:hypothetical protein
VQGCAHDCALAAWIAAFVTCTNRSVGSRYCASCVRVQPSRGTTAPETLITSIGRVQRARHPPPPRFRLLLTLAFAATGIVACDRAVAPGDDAERAISAANQRSGTQLDPSIDRTSSHASIVMTESFVDTVFAPDGRPELQRELPSATTQVQLGFDQWGNQVASLSTIADPDPDLQGAAIEHVRVVGATHHELDAAWQQLSTDPQDPETAAPPPLPDLNQVPTLVPYFEGQPMEGSYFGRATGALSGQSSVEIASLAVVPEDVTLATLAPGRVLAVRESEPMIGGTSWSVREEEERRLVDGRWELARHGARIERPLNGGRVVSRYDVTYTSIATFRNRERDAIRALALGSIPMALASQAARLFEAPALDCQPTRGAAPSNPLYSPPVCPPPEMEPPPPPPTPEYVGGPTTGLGTCGRHQFAPTHQIPGRPGLLLLHGYRSDACTWSATADTLRRTMALPALVAGSTPAEATYDVQASVAATFPGVSSLPSFVAVGHSNGGIVSRVMLQQGVPRLAGVVTMNSPHLGAGPSLLSMMNTFNSASLIAGGVLGILQGTPVILGNIFEAIFQRDPHSRASDVLRIYRGIEGIAIGTPSTDVLSQMAPGSARLSALNATAESFPRAAVWTVAPERMIAFRLWGEISAAGDPVAGDRSVARYERRKRRWRRWGWIGVAAGRVMGRGLYVVGGNLLHAGSAAIGQVNAMWPRLVRAGMPGPDFRSDGIVTATSQQYPGVPGERLYFANGPTHFSTLRRTESMVALRRAVRTVDGPPCKDSDVVGCQ